MILNRVINCAIGRGVVSGKVHDLVDVVMDSHGLCHGLRRTWFLALLTGGGPITTGGRGGERGGRHEVQ